MSAIQKQLELLEIDSSFVYETDLMEYLAILYETKRKDVSFFVAESKANKNPKARYQWIQKRFNPRNLEEAKEFLAGTDLVDVYCSTSLHTGRNRTEESVSQIPALILDLDFYKMTEFQNYSVEKFIKILDKEFFETGRVPYPNAVTNSGGGSYLIWLLKYTPGFDKTLLKRKVIMKILYEIFKPYGADSKSLDASHVFRLPGSFNGKNGAFKLVSTKRNGIPRYTLAGIGRALPSLWDVLRKNKSIEVEKPGKLVTKKKIASVIPIHKEKTLAYDTIYNFIFRLVEIREGNVEGYRECLCFVARNYYHWMHKQRFEEGDESLYLESLAVAEQLNNKFKNPLKPKELQHQTLNRTKLYRFKTETLYEWFDITTDEAIQLKRKTKEVKNEKSKRQMRELRGSVSREEYLAKQQYATDQKLEFLRKILNENPGLKWKAVAEMMGISDKYLRNLRKKI